MLYNSNRMCNLMLQLSTGSETAHTQNAYNIVLTHTEQTLEWKRPLQSSDSGLYECVARNNLGEARATLNLTVVRKHNYYINVIYYT